MPAQYLFGFHLIPREAVMRMCGDIPPSVDWSVIWSQEWSPYRLPDDWEVILTSILPACTPRGLLSSVWMWGFYEQDRVQVAVQSGIVKSIGVRADLRRLTDSTVTRLARLFTVCESEELPVTPDDSFLSGIADFAKASDCLMVVDESARLIYPHELMTAVRVSSAYKFVCTCDCEVLGWCRPSDVLSQEEMS